MDQKNEKKKQLNEYVKYSGIAMQMVVTFCLATWAGLKLDAHFQVKSHIITIFLLLFAVVSSIYFVIKSVTK